MRTKWLSLVAVYRKRRAVVLCAFRRICEDRAFAALSDLEMSRSPTIPRAVSHFGRELRFVH
jgi:hypothetical protein